MSQRSGCLDPDIKLGPIRIMRNEFGTIWIQYSIAAANRIASEGRLRSGWFSVRAEVFDVRPTQCYRYWKFGHVRGTCKSSIDRSGHCFQCGGSGHNIRNCSIPPCCVLCRDKGLYHGHRLGSLNCGSWRRFRSLSGSGPRRGPGPEPRPGDGPGPGPFSRGGPIRTLT